MSVAAVSAADRLLVLLLVILLIFAFTPFAHATWTPPQRARHPESEARLRELCPATLRRGKRFFLGATYT